MRWTRKAIVEEIRRLFSAGEELNYSAVEEKHLNLVRAAAWHYGTWKRAVEKAGLDYEDISKYQRWTQERVIERIQELHSQGKDLSWRAVSMEVDPPLAAAALRPNSGFSTWYDAITRAGLNHDEIARYRRWTSQRVLEELRARSKRGEPMSSIMVQRQNPSLYCAAKRRFLQWDNALSAAGLDPDKIRIRRAPAEPNATRRRKKGEDQAVAEVVSQARRGRKKQVEAVEAAPTSRARGKAATPKASAAPARGSAARATAVKAATAKATTAKATAAKAAPAKPAAKPTAKAAASQAAMPKTTGKKPATAKTTAAAAAAAKAPVAKATAAKTAPVKATAGKTTAAKPVAASRPAAAKASTKKPAATPAPVQQQTAKTGKSAQKATAAATAKSSPAKGKTRVAAVAPAPAAATAKSKGKKATPAQAAAATAAVAKPAVTKPAVAKPAVAKPAVAKPAVAKASSKTAPATKASTKKAAPRAAETPARKKKK